MARKERTGEVRVKCITCGALRHWGVMIYMVVNDVYVCNETCKDRFRIRMDKNNGQRYVYHKKVKDGTK